jgi:hypothetical protein
VIEEEEDLTQRYKDTKTRAEGAQVRSSDLLAKQTIYPFVSLYLCVRSLLSGVRGVA